VARTPRRPQSGAATNAAIRGTSDARALRWQARIRGAFIRSSGELAMSSFAVPLRQIVLCIAVSSLAAGSALAQMPKLFTAGSGPDELWDVTMKMEMPGMPMAMPPRTSQVCKKKAAGNEALMKGDPNCRMSNVRTAGNKTSFVFTCTGEHAMTGEGEITATGDTFDSRMHLKSTAKGQEFEMTQTSTGKRVGQCTDTSQQAIAEIKAQAEGNKAQACAEMMARLEPEGFIGAQAPCATSRKAYCDKVASIASTGRTPAGYRAATGQAPAQTLERAFAACGQDYAAMRQGACAAGVASRDWAFVANGSCDDDVRVAGDANCKGRSFTGMDRGIAPLCSRYASLVRGQRAPADVASAQPAPAAAAQPANPLESGVNAVRKLLPF
jgi:hypothetical protein